jgi:hypothetical protein
LYPYTLHVVPLQHDSLASTGATPSLTGKNRSAAQQQHVWDAVRTYLDAPKSKSVALQISKTATIDTLQQRVSVALRCSKTNVRLLAPALATGQARADVKAKTPSTTTAAPMRVLDDPYVTLDDAALGDDQRVLCEVCG